MKIHILGICGTFMGGIAAIARAEGYEVSGIDESVYPPMSDQLKRLGIELSSGYQKEVKPDLYDQYIVGNVMTRGMPVVESLLRSSENYISGPHWLGDRVLRHKQVYAVSGTHGKTTTSAMLAWILEDNGLHPGFLIGGVSPHFKQSARVTGSTYFVIEADEYDSAFFDKRSKFIHYHPNVLIINNLEYDHADIFADLQAIKNQFHHLLKIMPDSGMVIYNNDDYHIKDVLNMGCWTPSLAFGKSKESDYYMESDHHGMGFSVFHKNALIAHVDWQIPGEHNQYNAMAALVAAQQAGIDIKSAASSLKTFKNVKRRLESIGCVNGIDIYDDFAHHPTAIRTTLMGLKQLYPTRRLVVVLEPRSNSMRAGAHARLLSESLAVADKRYMLYESGLTWDMEAIKALDLLGVCKNESVDTLIETLCRDLLEGDIVVAMSNGGFADMPRRLMAQLE